MNHHFLVRPVLLFVLLGALAGPSIVAGQDATPDVSLDSYIDVVANDLDNPRGFVWEPDGSLYLALAGSGGPTQVRSTSFYGGETSSIVTVSDGCTSPTAEGFPSAYWEQRSWVWGVMDIGLLDGDLYALHGGGPQGWGLPETPIGVYRVQDDGSWELVADLAAFFKENPPSQVPGDYDPNGSVFDMEVDDDRLWITESNGGRLLTVTPDGAIDLITDLSAYAFTPTGLALDGDGGAFVAFLGLIPYEDGMSKVAHVDADGAIEDYWTDLTAVNDLVMGPDDVLYAVEMATENTDEPPYLTANSGRIVRQIGPDTSEAVATDLEYPVTMGFEGGALFIAGPAFVAGERGEGAGWLVQVEMTDAPVSLAGIADAPPTCDAGT